MKHVMPVPIEAPTPPAAYFADDAAAFVAPAAAPGTVADKIARLAPAAHAGAMAAEVARVGEQITAARAVAAEGEAS